MVRTTATPIQTGIGVAPASASETAPLLPTRLTQALGSVASGGGDPLAGARRRELVGLGLMTVSALGFSLMSLLVKIAGATFPTLEVVLARSVWQLALGVLIITTVFKKNPLGPPALRPWLLLRGTTGAVGLACYFYGLTHLPLADATVIFFTGPVFTAILAHFALHERFTHVDRVAATLSMFGIVLVAKPSFLFGVSHLPDDILFGRLLAVLACLAGAVLSAMGYVIVRKVGRDVHYLVHVIYFGGISTLVSGLPFVLNGSLLPFLGSGGGDSAGKFIWPRTTEEHLLLSGVGLAAFFGQALLNNGLQLSRAGPATLMRNLDVVFAFVFGVTIFHEIPDVMSILGSVIIVTCTIGMGLNKWLN
ncbi:hypothetical protein IWQ60_004094 [Tieghemiomyces parasiticus]|uniref:EamA domain-containing protein n=1 Tax=Tieghemiomyces parasiticus TaxID=78921 RepID=A0A9W8DU76_9FUNG|nr:hypothetical protein IWQ60_004094 [Tieghemiomyces parasiticus]